MSEQPEIPEQPDQSAERDNEKDLVNHQCPLPEGAVATSVVEIVEYLDEDCDRAYAFRFTSQSPVSQILGLLELAKINVLQSADFG